MSAPDRRGGVAGFLGGVFRNEALDDECVLCAALAKGRVATGLHAINPEFCRRARERYATTGVSSPEPEVTRGE